MREHLLYLAGYNRWANARIFDVAYSLADVDRRRDCQGFFKNLHATLDHVIVAERIWLARWNGDPQPFDDLATPLHDNFEALEKARIAQDHVLSEMVDRNDDAALAQELSYHNMAGEPLKLQKGLILLHLFNHATHHRGQCHHMLTQLGADAPVLDMPFYLLDL